MAIIKSKKFWISVGGVVAVVASHFFGVDETTVKEIVAIIVAYVLGQGIADLGKEKAKLIK